MAHQGYLYITEYRGVTPAHGDAAQAPLTPPLRDYRIDIYDDRATEAGPFDGMTRLVTLCSTCPCFLGWGRDATMNAHPLTETRTYGVLPGGKLSVIGERVE